MMVEGVERKLVAIVSADVAGYSRLISLDEVETVRTLTSYRETMSKLVVQHRGRVVDNPGDNALLEFPSATDAVECVIEIQEAITERNQDVPADRRMEFRIGVHLGEVMVEGDRIYGEGVNVAARLEAMAPVGGICVSKTVRDQVVTKIDATLTDLGEQTLKNIPEPVHTYRVEMESNASGKQPGSQAAASAPPAAKNNLPADMSSLVGRDEAIGEVKRLLQESRLVTLIGSGGVGKTRLGIAAARASMPSHPDGVWFIDLARLEDGDLLLQAIAEVLGVEPPALRSIEDALLDATRDGVMLFMLDNCDHLVEAVAHAVAVLLRGSPNVRVLATSQEVLQVTGETVWRVPSLGLPEPGTTAESIEASAAVDLFRRRSQAVDATFEITPDNAAAVASVCRHLGGIPLALELAAARTRSLSVTEIDTRLSETFDILTGGGRDMLPRHQTLRATIEWSYDHLDDDAQSFFDQLGVFVGSFTGEAVSVVTGLADDEAADAIDGLVARSLLQVAPGTQHRFRLLETLRHFALERLDESGRLDELRSRHLNWMMQLCLRESPKLMTGEQLEALAELREDVDDLRAALRWSLDSGQPEVGLRMGASLARFWFLAAMQQEGADWLEELLVADPEVSDLDMGRAQIALAQTLNRIGRTEDAAAHARHAVDLLEPLEEPQAFGWAQFYLAVTTTEPGYGNAADVETLYRASLNSFKEADYGPGIAMATLLLAGVALRRDPVESLEIIRPLLAMAEKTNNTNIVAHCLEFAGYANRKLGNTGEVAPAYARAIRLHSEIGNWACLCHAFEGLGGYLVANQREADAARIVGGTDTLRTHLSTVQSPYEQFMGDFYDWVDDLETRADLEPARQEGRAWSRDELVEQALQYLDSQP